MKLEFGGVGGLGGVSWRLKLRGREGEGGEERLES